MSSAKARAGEHAAVSAEERAAPVEEQLVVTADLIDEGKRHAMTLGDLAEHLGARRSLGDREGATRNVDQEIDRTRHELGHRIFAVARHGSRGLAVRAGARRAIGQEGLIVPRVFADGDADRRGAHREGHAARTGFEIAIFVEHVVARQESLSCAGDDLTATRCERRVVERAPFALRSFVDGAEKGSDAVGQRGDDFPILGERGADERRPIE